MTSTDALYTELTGNVIYDQHAQAFRHVAAYVVTDAAGDRVATVAFKYAASGLRTTCYLHVLGVPMVRAHANGGGYDKASAAVHAACRKVDPQYSELRAMIILAVKDEGRSWDGDLRAAGFHVLQAV